MAKPSGARLAGAAFVLALAMAAPPVLACTPALEGARALQSASYGLAFRPVPAPIPSGRHFVLEIAVCAKDGAALPALSKVDATMPAHRHGMNYRPSITARPDGRFRVEGLMFHMPGRWELVFELTRAGATERLTADHNLP
jgi:hypothetical protein